MKRSEGILFALVVAAIPVASLSAQNNAYLKIDGIMASLPAPHDSTIKLMAYENAATNSMTIGSGSTGLMTGKAAFAPLKVAMVYDPLIVPLLYSHMARGTRSPTVEVRVYDSADKLKYKIELTDAFITAVNTSAAGEVNTSFEIIYSTIRWWALKNGTMTPIAGWNIVMNIPK